MRVILITILFAISFPIKSSIITSGVEFGLNDTILYSSGKLHLNKMVEVLNQNPTLVVQLGGQWHPLENDSLIGIKRASIAKRYLVSRGVNEDRLEIASIFHNHNYYEGQYFHLLAKYNERIQFYDSLSFDSVLFSSRRITKIEFYVSNKNYPKEVADSKIKFIKSDSIINATFGIIIDNESKDILTNSKFTLNGSDGSSLEGITKNSAFYLKLNPNTTYQLQCENDFNDTICGQVYKKYYTSEKHLISTLNKGYNLSRFLTVKIQKIKDGCGSIIPNVGHLSGDTLSSINKLKLNSLVELLNENPTVSLYLKFNSKQIYADLVKDYIVKKNIYSDRLVLSKNTGFELNCWFVDKHKRENPDLTEGDFINEITILNYKSETQEILKPLLNIKLYFEIKSTKFNLNGEPSQKR